MEALARHRRIYRALVRLTRGWLIRKFNFTPERCYIGGPCLVIPNHVTNYDPLLAALSFPDEQMYFVASEHIFRWGALSKLISWLVDPIPRSKAASGADTARACLRRLRAGASVCLFAEGDTTWDGRSKAVLPATGKLAKLCGASLATYRFEGGYLSLPRWGKGARRGQMSGRVVNVYTPEQLAGMTAEEVNAAINRDIYEDAWQRQRLEPTVYRGAAAAENLETALFICPECGKVGGLSSAGDTIKCECGFEVRINEYGLFEPQKPFKNIAEWDAWQLERLHSPDFELESAALSDGSLTLTEVFAAHEGRRLAAGALRALADGLDFEGLRLPFREITGMSMIKASVLMISARGRYFEIRAKKPLCLRKYLLLWQRAAELAARA